MMYPFYVSLEYVIVTNFCVGKTLICCHNWRNSLFNFFPIIWGVRTICMLEQVIRLHLHVTMNPLYRTLLMG